MIRREIWWRNAALIIAMVSFGLWHKASTLFLIWGLYHGVLLVLHRQLQQLHRKWNWQTSSGLWTLVSWLLTMAVISLGWIFFRANSLAQASRMFSALASPGSYASHNLSESLYVLVALLAAGYAIILVVAPKLAPAVETPDSRGGFLLRSKWFWLPPLYALAMMLLLMITLSQDGGAAQLMYRGF
jgi:lysylphosphatidylglycerol synthetase-like protein (DUF2156 family)